MPITTLPTLDRTSPTFRADVDTFFGSQLPAFATEANALETAVNADEIAAALSADDAAASAATATSQASAALTSANNAATSKTGADNARNAALAAQAASELALDSFDDRYLGAKAVAPTLDNDGNALLIGALYWDTVLPGMRAWTGTAWSTLPAATAAATANTPAGNIAATTVQGAINELDSEKVSLTGNQTIAGIKTFTSFPVMPMPGDLFRKADPTTVAFTKLTATTAEIKAGTVVDVDGTTISFAAATAITMPALTAEIGRAHV